MAVTIHKEVVAPSDTRHLVKIREVVQNAVAQWAPDSHLVAKITLAVDEAVANVIEHAYSETEPGDVRVRISADEEKFVVAVVDTGREFDPNRVEMPDLKEHIRQGKRNGLGIFLMRQIMDEIKYTFVHGMRNELTMIKYRSTEEGENQ